MEYIKQSGVDHYKDRLYIHWDITTMCNYDCSYCYAKKQYNSRWMRPSNWKKQLEVINELSKSKLPVFLGLLGGEPTMHHKFKELVDLIVDKVLTHEDSRLYITTNGGKPTEWFNQQKDANGKIYMLWSLHAEYNTPETFETFYNNIITMHNKGYKTKVNLMLHPARKYWEFTKYCYERLAELDYVILHPHFIYSDHDMDVNYSNDFYEYFKFLENQHIKEFVFSTEDKDVIMSDYELFSNKLNQFKGWTCHHNNYEINNDCKIDDQCFNRTAIDIPKDFFKNITEIEPKICPYDFCSCDGLLKIRKEKNVRI